MRRLLLWSSVAGFTACLLQPTLATITPDYGYADGCDTVIVQGHHLGTNATARIGSAEFLSLTAWEDSMTDRDQDGEPDKIPPQGTDVGFKYIGVVPPSPDAAPGWYDVVVTVDGEELTINDGWYYRSCPGPIVVDAYDIPAEATQGDTLSFEGCNLNADTTEVQFVDAATLEVTSAALVSDCSSRFVHADVPNLAAGVYNVQLSNGTDVLPLQVCIGHSAFPTYAHSGYTGCDPVTVTVTAR